MPYFLQNNSYESPFDSMLNRVFSAQKVRYRVLDEKDSTVVRVELPGVSKENIHVSYLDGTIVVRAEEKESKVGEDNDQSSDFESYSKEEVRVFVGQGIDKNKISAKYENGVLRVTCPKIEQNGDGTIEIQ